MFLNTYFLIIFWLRRISTICKYSLYKNENIIQIKYSLLPLVQQDNHTSSFPPQKKEEEIKRGRTLQKFVDFYLSLFIFSKVL